jgi:riboflavin kinase/FMN adenylyltransferase
MEKPVYLDDVVRDAGTVLTVGTFDGVHVGHRALMRRVVAKARECGHRSVVVSFDPHPREILQPGQRGIRLLTTLEERAVLLAELGIDQLVVIPFTRDFSLLTSEQFIRDVLWGRIGMSGVVTGYDHHFGRNREGGIEILRTLGQELGFEVDLVQKLDVGDQAISSTVVRRALEDVGDVAKVAEYLERPYRLSGIVVHGHKRGRIIGFPTANLRLQDTRKMIPATGVYAVRVEVGGASHPGMMNIGFRPTFQSGETERHIEVHLIGFEGDLYGQLLHVDVLRRIRDEMRFPDLESLRSQLEIDRRRCLPGE